MKKTFNKTCTVLFTLMCFSGILTAAEQEGLVRTEITDTQDVRHIKIEATNVPQAPQTVKQKNTTDDWPWLRSDRMTSLSKGEGDADGVVLLAAWITGLIEAEKAAGRSCPPSDREATDRTIVAALEKAPGDAPAAAVASLALLRAFPCGSAKVNKVTVQKKK